MKSILNFLLVSLISSLLSIFIYINFFQINKITDIGERPQLIPASYSYNVGNSDFQKTDFTNLFIYLILIYLYKLGYLRFI